MKKIAIVLLLSILIISCNDNADAPDVSHINVDIKLERFDKDFFAIDSNNVLPELNDLNEKFPRLTHIFLQNILGLDSTNMLPGVKQFLYQNKGITDSVNLVFENTDWLEHEFLKAFRFVKYYFPKYKLPAKIITVVGPIDALAQSSSGNTPDFLGTNFMGISLQFYLGKNFSVYKDPFFTENVAPEYRSRRFSKEYIITDALQLIVDDIFPDKSSNKSLIEQMIEKGKQWWMLDKFLPLTPDSIKTGYTKQQLRWCNENEGLIWSYLLKNEDLNSLNPATIQTYIGEGPFTQGFSQELSPGNIGQWIGLQIVKKFADKNSELKPEEVMRTDPKKILEEAKYKPK
ncbi:MAG: hypothetical protein JJE22_07020 [Bacteroidia bacterium]|nr:hypothetical protein [Bacteroidia bacterium]